MDTLKENLKHMTKPESVRVTMRAIVGLIVTCGFVSMAIYLVAFSPTFESRETLALVGTVVGYLSAKADTIVGWYFGSSQSSMEKSDTMENILSNDKLG